MFPFQDGWTDVRYVYDRREVSGTSATSTQSVDLTGRFVTAARTILPKLMSVRPGADSTIKAITDLGQKLNCDLKACIRVSEIKFCYPSSILS